MFIMQEIQLEKMCISFSYVCNTLFFIRFLNLLVRNRSDSIKAAQIPRNPVLTILLQSIHLPGRTKRRKHSPALTLSECHQLSLEQIHTSLALPWNYVVR